MSVCGSGVRQLLAHGSGSKVKLLLSIPHIYTLAGVSRLKDRKEGEQRKGSILGRHC